MSLLSSRDQVLAKAAVLAEGDEVNELCAQGAVDHDALVPMMVSVSISRAWLERIIEALHVQQCEIGVIELRRDVVRAADG